MKKLLLLALILTVAFSLSCFQIVVPDQSGIKINSKIPTAFIDSILPAAAAQGEAVVFNGHGTDSDGTIIGYEWRSNMDGIISTAPSFTSTLLSTGTHSISFRVLDNTSQWSNTVSSPVTITPKAPAPFIEIFIVIPNTVVQGNPVELQWKVSGARSVTIDNGVGKVAESSSMQIYPVATTSFTLTAVNDAGISTKTVTVTVQQSNIANSNPTIDFTAVHVGGTTWRLNWTVRNATQVVIEPEIGPVNLSGTRDVMIPSGQDKIYRLTARNNWGWAYWQVILMSP